MQLVGKVVINKLAIMSNLKQSTPRNLTRGDSRNLRITILGKVALTFIMALKVFLNFPELNGNSFDDESPDE